MAKESVGDKFWRGFGKGAKAVGKHVLLPIGKGIVWGLDHTVGIVAGKNNWKRFKDRVRDIGGGFGYSIRNKWNEATGPGAAARGKVKLMLTKIKNMLWRMIEPLMKSLEKLGKNNAKTIQKAGKTGKANISANIQNSIAQGKAVEISAKAPKKTMEKGLEKDKGLGKSIDSTLRSASVQKKAMDQTLSGHGMNLGKELNAGKISR